MRVLLIENGVGDSEFINHIFRQTRSIGEMVCANGLSAALESLRSGSFDVVLIDLSSTAAAELKLVASVRNADQDISIIALTRCSDYSAAKHAIDEGAQDHLITDLLTPDSLERSLRYAMHRQDACNEKRRLVRDVEQVHELLKRKNRRLKRLYKMGQDFVDHVSHEFRTPLSVIKDYASIVEEGVVGPLNDEQRRMLEIVDDRADDLNTMVDDMLDVSKLNAGLLDVSRKECAVGNILSEILPLLKRKAAVRKVSLQLILDPDLPNVFCDADRASRVVVNLCMNAIKNAGEGGKIELCARADLPRNNVLIRVVDNGPVIAPQHLTRISKRFARAKMGLPTNLKGSGLGLNVAIELVKLNFGRLAVESEMGKGRTFSFTLPLAIPREIVSRCLAQIVADRRPANSITLLRAHCDGQKCKSLTEDAGKFLSFLMRRTDLLFHCNASCWLLLLPIPTFEIQTFMSRAEKLLRRTNRNRPFTPLPKIQYEVLGAWSPLTEQDEILAIIDHHFPSPVLAAV